MKLFASDFDGTLRHYDRKEPYILKEDVEAIASYRAEGNLFGMCSGRAFDSLLREQKGIPFADFYIVSTGAIIGKVKEGRMEIQYEKTIPRTYAKELFDLYGDHKVFYVHMDGYLYRVGRKENGETAQIFVKDFADLPSGRIEGISVGTDSMETAARITEEINRQFCDAVSAFQNNDYLDTVAKGCSKGEGIRMLRSLYEADLIGGIGDSYNDIPLLEAADVSFTFDYSPREVQAHADHVVHTAAQALDIFSKL